MATQKVTAIEMKDGDAKFVSLVGRSASRIPFRIMKQANEDGTMSLDLTGIMRATKSDTEHAALGAVEPQLVGVAVAKTNDMTAMASALKGAGINVDSPVENADGTVTYVQSEFDAKDVSLLRVSDEMVFIVKGFCPWAGEGTFNDRIKAEGFYQGLGTAADVARSCIYSELDGAKTPAEAVTKVEKVLTDFTGYVKALITQIPQTAFKADAAHALLAVAKSESKGGVTTGLSADAELSEDETAILVAKGWTPPAKKDKDKEMSDEEKAAADAEKEKAKKGDEAGSVVAGAVNMDALANTLLTALKTEFDPKFAALTSSLAAVETAQKETDAKVNTAVQKSDEVASKLATTVSGLAPSDPEAQQPVVKSETPLLGQTFYDSASMRRA